MDGESTKADHHCKIPDFRSSTTTVTSTVSSGVSTVTNDSCSAGNEKRQATATKPEPSVLKQYPSGPTLSSACSCLQIPTGTTTISAVGTTTTTPKTTITIVKTVQGAGKVTRTATTTVPSSTSTVNSPAATCPPDPIIKDPSFESCPDSSIDTNNMDYTYWAIAGAVKFEKESTDGFSSPFGNIHVHFYGNDQRTAQLIQPYAQIGDMTMGQTYTLTFSMKITKNDGVSPDNGDCYMNADFGNSQEIWHREISSSDTPGDWQSIQATFQYPYDGKAVSICLATGSSRPSVHKMSVACLDMVTAVLFLFHTNAYFCTNLIST